jgi:hypothetical protein
MIPSYAQTVLLRPERCVQLATALARDVRPIAVFFPRASSLLVSSSLTAIDTGSCVLSS